jgi:hypothetical protein
MHRSTVPGDALHMLQDLLLDSRFIHLRDVAKSVVRSRALHRRNSKP